jgi:hypothetical protein
MYELLVREHRALEECLGVILTGSERGFWFVGISWTALNVSTILVGGGRGIWLKSLKLSLLFVALSLSLSLSLQELCMEPR